MLYDGECGFCGWTVRQLRLLDLRGRFEFIPLQAAALRTDRPELALLAAERPLAEMLHVVLPDGRVEAGGRAFMEILLALPGGSLFRPWPLIPGLQAVIDAGYRWAAAHRPLLSRALRIG